MSNNQTERLVAVGSFRDDIEEFKPVEQVAQSFPRMYFIIGDDGGYRS